METFFVLRHFEGAGHCHWKSSLNGPVDVFFGDVVKVEFHWGTPSGMKVPQSPTGVGGAELSPSE